MWILGLSLCFPFLTHHLQDGSRTFFICILVGIGARVGLIQSPAYFEDDFHRYLVEGQALSNGVDPYLTSPEEFGDSILFSKVQIPQELRKSLYIHSLQAGYSWMPAIYPPLVIYWFSFSDSLQELGFFSLALEILILSLCYLLLPPAKRWVLLLWFLHPLVLVEGYLNRHYDLLIGLCLLFTLCSKIKGWSRIAGIALGFAVHLKGYALIYLPFFSGRVLRFGIGSLLLLEFISYLWYPTRFDSNSSMELFVSLWEFNNGIFTGLRILAQRFMDSSSATLYLRILFAILLAAGWLFVYRHREESRISPFLQVTLLFMLLSPVANPWYFLMSIPFFLLPPQQPRHWFLLAPCSLYYLLYLCGDPLRALWLTTPVTLLILVLALRKTYNKKPVVGSQTSGS